MFQKATSVATQAGGGTAFASGASYVLGLSTAQWSVIGVIGGLAIGLAGFVFNAWLGYRRLQIEERRAK